MLHSLQFTSCFVTTFWLEIMMQRYQAFIQALLPTAIFRQRILLSLLARQGCHSFYVLEIEEIWEDLRRIEEISNMNVLVDLTFTDVMSRNINEYSRRNTTFTLGTKWFFNMKFCNLHYIILTIWTHTLNMYMNKHFIPLISDSVQD